MVRAVKVSSRWPERLSFTVLYGDQSQFVKLSCVARTWSLAFWQHWLLGVTMGIPLEVAAQTVQGRAPFPGRMSPVSLPGGATVIRDDWKAPLWTIPSALKFMEEAEAKRKIVVVGTISDYRGDASSKYVKVARQALDVADYVFFVGPWASRCLRAKQNPADDRLQAFSNVQAVTQFLNDFLQPEDLVLIKGSDRTDHLVEIVLNLKKQDVGKKVAAKPQFSDARNLQQIPSATSSTGHTVAQSNNHNPLEASPQLLPVEDLNRVQVLVGLGNPEKKYQDTPHNVGQKAMDKLLLLMGGSGLKNRIG